MFCSYVKYVHKCPGEEVPCDNMLLVTVKNSYKDSQTYGNVALEKSMEPIAWNATKNMLRYRMNVGKEKLTS